MTPTANIILRLLEVEIKHINIFNIKPYIIGYYKNNLEQLAENILKSIEDNKPYNEYELLTDEEKKAFDKGELLF